MPHKIAISSVNLFSEHKFEYASRSPSPYPPDSDDDSPDVHASQTNLRSSIASLPESNLRSILVKLADSNPRFQHAITKELAYHSHAIGASSPTSPTTPKPRKSRRTQIPRNGKRHAAAKNSYDCPRTPSTSLQESDQQCLYHPGHLVDEVYEFLSGNAEDVAFNVVRTISMWSCCDDDEWSPGCVTAPSFKNQYHQTGILESHTDLISDSDLEQNDSTPPVLHL